MKQQIQSFGIDGPSFSDILDFFPDPCFAIDLQGKVIAWNHAMEELSGVRAQDMLGKGNYEYALPFYGYRRPILIDLVLSWNEQIASQYKYVKKYDDGLDSEVENPPFKPQITLLWNKARKIYNAKGDCIGAMEVIRDITEWKKSEQELKRTEAEKALILNTTSELIAYYDLDLRIKWVNNANAIGLRRSAGDSIGRLCYELWHNRTGPCAGCPVVKAKLTGLPQQAEITTPDGRCWLARGYPVFDESKNLTGLIEFTLEITDRKRAEEKLRETSDSLTKAQRIARIGNWDWDIDSGHVTWSDEMYRIFGIEKQQPSYDLAKSLVHPQDLQFWEQAVQSALSSGLFQIDYRAVRPDGTVVWIHNEAIITRDDKGRPVKFTGTAQDVTAQKNNEIELKNQEKQLRHYIKLHQLIARVSSLFANSTVEDLDFSINQALADIGLFIGTDRSYLFQFSHDLSTSSNTHEWCAVGIKPEIRNLQNIASAPLEWKMSRLRKGENVLIQSVANLPEEAQAEKKLLQSQDIRSLLIVPVKCGGNLFGFLGLNSVHKERTWTDEDIMLLRTVSEIVGNTIRRIQNEQALRQSEDKFSKAFHNSPGFLFITDFKTGEYIAVNNAYCELSGYTTGELIGKTSIGLGILSDEQRLEMTDELVRKGKIESYENRIRTKSGDIRTRIFSAALIELQGRRCIVASGVDITDRKKTEDALKESEKEKTFILESISDMVAYYDFDMKLKWANKAWLQAAGKELEMVLGRHCYQVWHNKDSPCSGCPVAKSRFTGKPEEAEVQHGDGPIWHMRGCPVFKENGTASAIIEFTRDISIQKKSEQAMKTARDDLDRKVRERTAELEHRNRQIRELAHKTIQAMENDRRALAKELHDSIGGTLAAIMYQLESRIENSASPPSSVKFPLEKIISYLRNTIAESRRITKQLRPSVLDDFGLVAAIEENIKDFNLFYPSIKILQQISTAVESLSSDAKTVLYRVLQEALNNVGRHSTADKVDIRCEIHNDWVRLTIKDNGAGFNVNRVIESLKHVGGYGLHSMRERLEICNGTFQIESAPGKGTIIIAALPRK